MKRAFVDLTEGEPGEHGEAPPPCDIGEAPDSKRPRTLGEVLTTAISPLGPGATLEAIQARFAAGIPDRRTARDDRVTFVVSTHKTFLDGDMEHPLAGVTDTIESRFFAKFDEEGVAKRLATKAKDGTYKGKYKDKTAEEMRAYWRGKRDSGSAAHDGKETILRGLPLTDAQRATACLDTIRVYLMGLL